MHLSRRDFAKHALAAGGSAALGCAKRIPPSTPIPPPSYPDLPDPSSCGIEHVVVITMENRSFDHLLGWLPNADGRQAGLSFVDKSGHAQSTHSLSGDFTGCPHPDPDHSYAASRVAYNGGKMDGFLRAGSNDVYSIGYYEEKDIPFYAALARNYTTCDRYFASILGPTFPNRMFLYAAQTDRTTDSVVFSSLPTIFDRLAAAKVSHNYFYSNVPYLALWGIRYLRISKLHEDFLEQAGKSTLPAVSFVDPRYTILDDGTGNDDHPHADIREGDRFLYDMFEAIASGPAWSKTVVVINFDEWGGLFDHVAPPRAAAANTVDTDIVDGKTLLGLRVPVVIASPFSRGEAQNPRISSLVYDHTSVLKLIEWRWGLAPLTPRDGSSDVHNLAYALDFKRPQIGVPDLPRPDAPLIATPCLENVVGVFRSADAGGAGETSSASRAAKWNDLHGKAAKYGFKVK
ncbi:MAG: alkaline phosphatase family protein [Acidobacteriota bacterium]|nr:alkaline phosphatase family protein [Acidobacteriota bacterium]